VIQPPSEVGPRRRSIGAVALVAVLAVALPVVGLVGRLASESPSAPPVTSAPVSAARSASPPTSAGPSRSGPRAIIGRTILPLVGGPMAVALGARHLWVVTAGDDSVRRIDRDGRPDGPPIPLVLHSSADVAASGAPPTIGIAGGRVWLGNVPAAGDLVAVDATTGAVTATLVLGSEPVGIAGGFGWAWVATADGGVVRVAGDGSARTVVAPGGGPAHVAIGRDAVWISRGRSIVAVRPAALSLRSRIAGGGGEIAVRDGGVWVLGWSGPNRSLLEIDETSGRVVYGSDVGTSGYSGIAWALPSIVATDYADANSLVAPRSTDSVIASDATWISRPLEGELWRIALAR
jgi:hypothetical protein